MRGFTFQHNGLKWRVKFISEATMRELCAGDNPEGYTLYKPPTIVLRKIDDIELLIETFWHEMSHVFFVDNLGTNDDADGKIGEELACNMVGSGMRQLAKQNLPKWVYGR